MWEQETCRKRVYLENKSKGKKYKLCPNAHLVLLIRGLLREISYFQRDVASAHRRKFVQAWFFKQFGQKFS